jgi:cytochrome c-type biogenesis protein CcmH
MKMLPSVSSSFPRTQECVARSTLDARFRGHDVAISSSGLCACDAVTASSPHSPSFPRKREFIADRSIEVRLRRCDLTVSPRFVRWLQRTLWMLLAALALSTAAVAAVDPLPFKDRAEELRFQNLTKQLRCLVCQNESLNDSSAPLAADLRRDVFEQMQAGKSDEEIKQWLTARYSDFVLYDPPLRGPTWLLWFGPLLVLAAGAGAVFVTVRRRAKSARPPAASATRPASDLEDDW